MNLKIIVVIVAVLCLVVFWGVVSFESSSCSLMCSDFIPTLCGDDFRCLLDSQYDADTERCLCTINNDVLGYGEVQVYDIYRSESGGIISNLTIDYKEDLR